MKQNLFSIWCNSRRPGLACRLLIDLVRWLALVGTASNGKCQPVPRSCPPTLVTRVLETWFLKSVLPRCKQVVVSCSNMLLQNYLLFHKFKLFNRLPYTIKSCVYVTTFTAGVVNTVTSYPRSYGLLEASVAVSPAPVWLSSQKLLAPSVTSVTSINWWWEILFVLMEWQLLPKCTANFLRSIVLHRI